MSTIPSASIAAGIARLAGCATPPVSTTQAHAKPSTMIGRTYNA
ncbi:MAG: hypothetical protein AAF331_01455 [Pseudomonadota bacterium]